MTTEPENDSKINEGYSLGKGEVLSSILSGSTSYALEMLASRYAALGIPAVSGRTERGHDVSSRGKSVDSVRQPFTGENMTPDQIKELRKPLIVQRMSLTNLINTLNELLADPENKELAALWEENRRGHEERYGPLRAGS